MVIKVTDENIAAKKRSFDRAVLTSVCVPVITIVLFVLILMFSFGSFHVYGNLSDEEKTSLAKEALMPHIAAHIERYGVRGFQDPDVQIETKAFGSIDELVAAMPTLGIYKNSTVSRGSDIKGKSAKKYELAKVNPVSNRQSLLPLNFSSVSDQEVYWTWEYSILEYKDGSCRLVILEVPS